MKFSKSWKIISYLSALTLFFALIFLYFLYKNTIALIFAISLIPLAFSLPKLYRLNKNKKKKNEDIATFVHAFSFLKIYLSSGFTVYDCLFALKDNASSSLKEKLSVLIEDINEDKTIKPYLRFASHFEDEEIKETMFYLYEISNIGYDENFIKEFFEKFDSFAEMVTRKSNENKIRVFNALIFSSLLGNIAVVIILIYVVLRLLEGVS